MEGERETEDSARLLPLTAEQTRVYKARINILKCDRLKQFLFLKRNCTKFSVPEDISRPMDGGPEDISRPDRRLWRDGRPPALLHLLSL